jgi:cytoskeletal protein RodZ
MTFMHKPVGEEGGTFGSDLRALRELSGLSLQQAASATKIRDTILAALEEDRMADLDDPAFVEHHLLAYVRYLGGHEQYFIARYRERLKALHAERQVSELLPRVRKIRRRDLFSGPQLLALAGLVLFAVGLGGYVAWQAALVRIQPPLEVTSPVAGERLSRPVVTVQGKTMPEAEVTVSGRSAPVDGTGAFTVSLDVRRGTTVLTIVARRRRGSETTMERSVVYDAPLEGTEFLDVPTFTSSTTSSTVTATGTH